jgi:tripartite-type tricarboxylate transporter receptor subunit TctC
VRTNTPEEFNAWIVKAIGDWGEVVKAEGIQIDG